MSLKDHFYHSTLKLNLLMNYFDATLPVLLINITLIRYEILIQILEAREGTRAYLSNI